jgi:hypothetical protein
MKSKIKVLVCCLLLGLVVANFASALLVTCGGFDEQTGRQQPECSSIGDLIGTIKLIINTLLSWAWLVAIFFIVISGFRMIFSRGDSEAISTAKTSLRNAIMGFILILLSFVILNLVVGLLIGGGQLNSGSLIDAFHLVP